MREATAAVLRYAAHAGIDDTAGGAAQPPGWLSLPLRERVRRMAAGELDAEAWRREADGWSRYADSRYRACVELRPTHPEGGPVRVGVKDSVDVAGFPTRLGLRRHRHYPAESAACLRTVNPRSVIAKLVTPEVNVGMEHGCLNPKYPHLDPAGSSTGCAVAVAADLCDIGLGTDTVASVRLPAARCGVVGLRMTQDPGLAAGLFPVCPPLDAPGWLSRTADDLAFFWRQYGLDRLPGSTAGQPEPGRPLRVGVVAEVHDGLCDPEILGALEQTCAALSDAGNAVVPVRLGDLWRWRGAVYELCTRAAWDAHQAWRGWTDERLDEATRLALEAGAAVPDARYDEIRTGLESYRRSNAGRFAAAGVDLWLLPLAPIMPRNRHTTAPPVSAIPAPGEPEYERRIGYTPVAAFAGLPAITFPVATSDRENAPIALQAIAGPGAEWRLIRFAATVETILGRTGVPA
ncbi:amidase family protein [Plantactinospora sp. WMMB334]|uniref:amidase family protein n=1 Tax=Plantactinospora sp. WMMB334 TaxID=3404119 RepID=UPI003B92D35E